MLGYHPTPEQAPPPHSRHPPIRHPLQAVHAGRYGQQAGDMHPTEMQSCLFGGPLDEILTVFVHKCNVLMSRHKTISLNLGNKKPITNQCNAWLLH